jgi:hypothetical protein
MRPLAILGALSLTVAATQAVPYRWVHPLAGDCSWSPRPAFRLIGSIRDGDRAAQWACEVRKGAKSPQPLSITGIDAKWPR